MLPELFPSDIHEAKQYLRRGSPSDRQAFARRQLSARNRLFGLLNFYRESPCRMARLHLLTASSVVIGRFCGFSETFNALGEAIMPVDESGKPRTPEWEEYLNACATNKPGTIRDELWLEAHARDWQALQDTELDVAFFAEAAEHKGDPMWDLLQRHAEITVGSRRFEQLARTGVLPRETTISLTLGLALRQAALRGRPVVRRYFSETLRALFTSNRDARPGLVSYHQTALTVLRSFITAWGAWGVYQRGLRIKNRGVQCSEEDWPLLETILGNDVDQVHPLIVKFYRNPGRFDATAQLEIRTLPLMFYSRLAAMLLGQGAFEDEAAEIPARLRVFRRQDGSMHFIRELYCGGVLRVFDSDFVLRNIAGKPALVEIFGDIGVHVVLDALPQPEGGVAVVGRDIFWHGIRLPRTALKIDFTSRVLGDEDGNERIEITGRLRMATRTALGRFVMHTLLRRPRDLGSIKYLLGLRTS